MAHQEGWIELYGLLEENKEPATELIELCKSSRTGIGETMLHWYAIEGSPEVLSKLIDIGFDVNVQNDFGRTPIMEASIISRWDNAKVLFDNGADLYIQSEEGEDYYMVMEESDVMTPDWIPVDESPMTVSKLTFDARNMVFDILLYWQEHWDWECPTLMGITSEELTKIIDGWPSCESINPKVLGLAVTGTLREFFYGATTISKKTIESELLIPIEEGDKLAKDVLENKHRWLTPEADQ